MKLLRLLSLPLLSLSLTAVLLAQGGPSPYPPKSDEAAWPGSGPIRVGEWMDHNRAAFWQQREKGQGAVVFVGDSLIGGWKGLSGAFPGIKVANRGIGGDVSRGTLFRFEEDVLALNPRALVFCVGTNDLSAHGNPADVVSNIALMVAMARKANPGLPIVVCTIPPRNVPTAPLKPGALDELNSLLRAFATDNEKLVVADLFTALATPEGAPDPAYIGKDGIHITAAGFERCGEVLRPALASLGVVAPPDKK